jgi:hypothetical protein
MSSESIERSQSFTHQSVPQAYQTYFISRQPRGKCAGRSGREGQLEFWCGRLNTPLVSLSQ